MAVGNGSMGRRRRLKRSFNRILGDGKAGIRNTDAKSKGVFHCLTELPVPQKENHNTDYHRSTLPLFELRNLHTFLCTFTHCTIELSHIKVESTIVYGLGVRHP